MYTRILDFPPLIAMDYCPNVGFCYSPPKQVILPANVGVLRMVIYKLFALIRDESMPT